eukprot:TRINITY_DN49930_c0_g1_i1.p1 TRINITY_DN49930_c0_g1~~TRINITY_DN49930_c0_g1_i1.p1  ORF type:complete len:407 (+),score=131.37 TRINITY_DN49930_c0_g1_i1:102-1223(+)
MPCAADAPAPGPQVDGETLRAAVSIGTFVAGVATFPLDPVSGLALMAAGAGSTAMQNKAMRVEHDAAMREHEQACRTHTEAVKIHEEVAQKHREDFARLQALMAADCKAPSQDEGRVQQKRVEAAAVRDQALDHARHQLEVAQREKDNARVQVEVTQREKHNATHQIEVTQREKDHLVHKLQVIQSETDHARQQLEVTQRERDHALRQVDVTRVERDRYHTVTQELSKKLTDSERQLRDANREAAELRRRIRDAECDRGGQTNRVLGLLGAAAVALALYGGYRLYRRVRQGRDGGGGPPPPNDGPVRGVPIDDARALEPESLQEAGILEESRRDAVGREEKAARKELARAFAAAGGPRANLRVHVRMESVVHC